jgi:RIP metalloprotease RseP
MDNFSPLFSNFKGILVLILFFGGSIFIHEFGHYLAAKWRKLKIERFSIGFGPRLFGWKNKDGVDFRVSLLPLGGYVALPQLADMGRMEGGEEEEGKEAPLPPITYADKVIVSVAGAVFNVIFALCMATLLWQIGQPSTEGQQTTTIGYVSPELHLDDKGTVIPGPAKVGGLLPGDIVLAIDGQEVRNFMEIQHAMVTGSGRTKDGQPLCTFRVERAGNILDLEIQPGLVLINKTSGDRIRQIGISPASHIVTKLYEGTPAKDAGLELDDRILSINGSPTYSIYTLRDVMEENGYKPISLGIERNGQPMELAIHPMHAAERKTTVAIRTQLAQGKTATFHFLPKYTKEHTELPLPEAPSTWILFQIEGDLPASLDFQPKIGDTLRQIGTTHIASLQSIQQAFPGDSLPPDSVLSLQSGDTILNLKLSPDTQLEVTPSPMRPILGLGMGGETRIHLNPITQVQRHIRTTIQVLTSLLNTHSDISVKQLSGPIGIGRVFHKYANVDFRLVIVFAVLLNINLAILNLLPIPVLDGGHILFATIAKLRKSPLPINFIVRIQTAFVLLLFSMIIYVGVYDSLRWKGDHDEENTYKVLSELRFKNTILAKPATPENPSSPDPKGQL